MVVLLAAVIILSGCNSADTVSKAPVETKEIIIAIPAEGKSIISSLISDYEKTQSGISVKLINIGGTTEKIHSFFVSALMDEKFNADMLIIDDIWLSELAGAGLVSEIEGMEDYDFIPAAKKGMMYDGKDYGVSLYADVMTKFRKKRTQSDKTVYFSEDVNDVSAYIRSEIMNGETIGNSYLKYLETEKIDNISCFIEQNTEIMQGWLSNYDTMQKYYPSDSSYIEIDIDENSLIKSKLAIINSQSEVKDIAIDIIKYLLKEESQIEIMNNITSISVMSKHYSDPIMIDRFPHLSGVSGKNFGTFPFLEGYNICEDELRKCMENGGEMREPDKILGYLGE